MKNLVAKSIAVGTMLMLFLSGCIADKTCFTPHNKKSERLVSLRVAQPTNTRSVSRPILDDEAAAFNTGNLYLVTSTGIIVQHYLIVSSGGTLPYGNSINRADLDDGVTLPSIPDNIAEVVIVGNTQKDNVISGNVSAVGTRLIDVITQHDAWNVNLFGRKELQPRTTPPLYSPEGNRIWEAVVGLAPTVARFEITDITATGDITSFTVEGIFIDNFYRQAQIDGIIASDSWVSNGQDANCFTYNSDAYPAAFSAALFDWFPNGLIGSEATSLTVSPTIGNVWSYQVFAQNNATAPPTRHPNIVIRLRDIELADGTQLANPQFITIDGFTYLSGHRLDGIRASHVYRILAGKILFDETNLSPRPNDKPINVEISTTLEGWKHKIVTQPPPFRQPNPEDAIISRIESHLFDLQPATGGSGNVSYIWQIRHKNSEGVWLDWADVNGMPTSIPELLFSAPEHGERYPFGMCPFNVLEDSVFFRRIAIDNVTQREIVTNEALLQIVDGIRLNGIIWAKTNVNFPGAFTENPEDFGAFFQWNRRAAWSSVDPLRIWNENSFTWEEGVPWNATLPTGTRWYPENDPCPPGWRVPTEAEVMQLVAAGNVREEINGVSGRLFGQYPNQIFLPTTMVRGVLGLIPVFTDPTHPANNSGTYWTSSNTGGTNTSTAADAFFFNNNNLNENIGDIMQFNRQQGFKVRCTVE